MIDETGKKWVLRTVNDLWHVYKSRLKEKHFTPYETDEERLAHKIENIPLQQFEHLLEYWNSGEAKETSKNNKRSRELQDDHHTMGPSSFALLRAELEKMDALQSTYNKEGDGVGCSKDPYREVVKNSHIHIYCRTVTKSKMKEVARDEGPSCLLPPEFLESIKKESLILVQGMAPIQPLPLQMSSSASASGNKWRK